MIRELPDEVKSYIRSGVAITSLTQCVEELLLNSIDAGATCVAIRVDIGCFKVQVVDNGHGIPPEELPLVGNRYSTSKCHTVSDLDDLRYFGYRGEALASIKDACGILEIVTKTQSCSKPLCKLFQDGKPLAIKDSAIPRPSVGTTVTVHALFMNFPVRQKSINEILELDKIRQRVAGLALMKPHVSIRLRNDATGTNIIHTNKCSNTIITFTSLFGPIKAQALVEINRTKEQFIIDGFLGREGSTKKDAQFVYVNERLVLKTKIHKLINQLLQKSAICKKKYDISAVSPVLPDDKDVLRKSPGKQLDKHPMYIINVKCPLTEYDITFDPAKTLVEFKDWDTLLQCITEVTEEFLKKEKLNQGSPDQNSNTEKAETEGVQSIAEISPVNIRDALVSRTAKRPGKISNNNMKTPEGIPLEKWKSENASLSKNPTFSISSETICLTEHSETLTNQSTSTQKSCNTETSCDKAGNAQKYKTQSAIGDKGYSSSVELVSENNTDKQISTFSDCNQPHVSESFSETIRKSSTNPRSALSLFRKTVGKASENLHVTTNIDESLKRISEILPSKTNGEEKSLSSLQRFRQYASRYERKVEEPDPDTPKQVLPAKFNKINDVSKVPYVSNIDCNLPDKKTDIEQQKQQRAVNMRSQTTGVTETLQADRKRPSVILNEKSSKIMKIHNDSPDLGLGVSTKEISNGAIAHDPECFKLTNDREWLGKMRTYSDEYHGNTVEKEQQNILYPCVQNDIHQSQTYEIRQNTTASFEKVVPNNHSIDDVSRTHTKGNPFSGAENSPNSIRGSQLFKNLPDTGMNVSQESDEKGEQEMFTAVPLDKSKLIQDIVKAGVSFGDEGDSQYSESVIPCTEDEEVQVEQGLCSSNECAETQVVSAESLMFDTTQKFTPDLINEEKSVENLNKSQGFTYKSGITMDSADTCSPASTGFTPRMVDDDSPMANNNTVNKSISNNNDISEDLNRTCLSEDKLDNYHNEKVKEADGCCDDNLMTQLSQDTLEMPSILDTSRLDMSDVQMQENISSKFITEMELADTRQPKPFSLQRNKYEKSKETLECCTDEVTVTQLLEMKNYIPSTKGSVQNTGDVLTFGDIFSQTQSQVDRTEGLQGGVSSGSTCEEASSKSNEQNDELMKMFSDTFDEEDGTVKDTSDTGLVEMTEDHGTGTTDQQTDQPEKQVDREKPEGAADMEPETENIEPDTDKDKDGDNNWIEMEHPDTGQKMFVHSKLGTVVDKIDITVANQELKTKSESDRSTMISKTVPARSLTTSVISKQSVTTLENSALQSMLWDHLQRDDDDVKVKWRDGSGEPDVMPGTSNVRDLFSEWENPVFRAISKSVMSVETGNITSKSSLKAMKTLHTCRFTKDMLKSVQVVGQLDKKFIVCLIQTDSSLPGPDLLAVIDQHAAHERVRLELLTEEAYVDGDVDKAELEKFPVDPGKQIKVDPEEIQVMMSYRDEFSRIGITFRVDTHNDDMIKVLSVPECLINKEAPDVQKRDSIYWDTIQTLIKSHVELLLTTEGAKGRLPSIIHKLLCSQACHGAIKFGDKLSLKECESLIHDLSLCDLPFQCAHGRPAVMPILQLQQLENKLPQILNQKPQLQKLRVAMEIKKIDAEDLKV